MKNHSICIIGAGLNGLILANKLKQAGFVNLKIVDKAKSVGGRMATRRFDQVNDLNQGRFDHGAQFYSLKSPIQELHTFWQTHNFSKFWFKEENIEKYYGINGMNSLAKSLAEKLQIDLNQKIMSCTRTNNNYILQTDQSESFTADLVISTLPLPQSLEILKKSQIPYVNDLDDIKYAKALVGLIEGVESNSVLSHDVGYVEFKNQAIFSIADQKSKGLTQQRCWSVVMSPDFSELNFEENENYILDKICESIIKLDPHLKMDKITLKKWRYSHPLNIFKSEFFQVENNFYLSGDAFGGPSLNGTTKSALSLFNHILKNNF